MVRIDWIAYVGLITGILWRALPPESVREKYDGGDNCKRVTNFDDAGKGS